MKNYFFVIILTVSCIAINHGCTNDDSGDNSLKSIYKPDPTLQITNIPESLGKAYTKNFDRYTCLKTPNNKYIHIVAQTNISNEKIVRSRNILKHYLTNYSGSQYGYDKSSVMNKMADNHAVLLLMNGEDDGSNDPPVEGQPLYDNEIQTEGHSWYVNQDYNHRDASYEEILHMVHDYGIGVDGPNTSPGALPLFQSEIRSAQQNALEKKLWGIGAKDWIDELTHENSLSQEYLASVIDSYYGLWGAWRESSTHGMWGIYCAKTRDEISIEDPVGAAIMNNKYFHPYLTYNARIDSGFKGTFHLEFDSTIAYTHHSQYLKDITLTGTNNSKVKVNKFDNSICGNNGINTVIFNGPESEYTVTKIDADTTRVKDNTNGRDGTNNLVKIEIIQFTDKTLDI